MHLTVALQDLPCTIQLAIGPTTTDNYGPGHLCPSLGHRWPHSVASSTR